MSSERTFPIGGADDFVVICATFKGVRSCRRRAVEQLRKGSKQTFSPFHFGEPSAVDEFRGGSGPPHKPGPRGNPQAVTGFCEVFQTAEQVGGDAPRTLTRSRYDQEPCGASIATASPWSKARLKIGGNFKGAHPTVTLAAWGYQAPKQCIKKNAFGASYNRDRPHGAPGTRTRSH